MRKTIKKVISSLMTFTMLSGLIVTPMNSQAATTPPSTVTYHGGQFYDLYGYDGQNAVADPDAGGWGFGGILHGLVDICPVTQRAAIFSTDDGFLDRFNTVGDPVQMVYAENVKFDDRASSYSGITYLTTFAAGRGYITYRVSAAEHSQLVSLDYMMFGCVGLDNTMLSNIDVYYSTSAPAGDMSTYLSSAVKSRTITSDSRGYYGPVSAENRTEGTISDLSGEDIYVTFELIPKAVGAQYTRFTGVIFDVTMTASHVHEAAAVEAPAACGEPGTQTYYFCEDCGGYFEDEDCTIEIADIDAWCAAHPIPATPHTTEHVLPVVADCLNPGNIEYWYCTVCHKYFSDSTCENEISAGDAVSGALGHDMNDQNFCNRCGYGKDDHIWRLGNNIALEDSILLRYFLVFDEWTLGEVAKGNISVDITVARVDGKPQSITYDSAAIDFASLRSTQKYKDGKSYLTYVFSLPTAAKQMTDIMTLTVTHKSSGRQLFVYSYSIQEYCYHKLNSTVPGLAYLVGKVAAYGKQAQIYGDYRLDHYADEWDKLNEYNEMNKQ